MEKIRIIGYGLAFGWLLICMGCSLFRNTAKLRETTHTDNRKSTHQVADAVTSHTADKIDFAASEIMDVSEAAIDFIAEGNVVIHPDGTVAADRVRGKANRTDTHTSSEVTESREQQQSAQVVSDSKETFELQTHEAVATEKRAWPNTRVYLILLALGLTIAISYRYKWWRRK